MHSITRILILEIVPNMHVGFNGAIWWLPRTVHRYSQLQPQCQCLDAHILSECDVPDFGDECRRRGRKRRLLPIRLGSTVH
jgi:hypothetical protein